MMKLLALALLISSQAQAAYISLPLSSGGSGTVTGVTATAPIQSTGGTAPVISCIAATGSVAGCLSAADWTTFNGKQASISNSTCTTHQFATSQTSGAIGCSALFAADIPTLNQNTTGTATNATNIATTATNSTSATFFPTFVGSSSSGNQGADTDSDLTYNASTNVISLGGGGLYSSTNGTETVQCGMSGGTRYTCNNSTHANSTFLTFATNTSAVGIGVGTFSNDYMFSMNGNGTTTYAASAITGAAVPMLDIRNTSNTTGNFEGVNFSSNSDNTVAWLAGVNITQTTSSEDGRLVLGTTSAGTKADKMKIEPKGQVSYGGTAPTVGTCGTSPAVTGNDNTSRVTIGTGGSATACTLTFAATWANAPICQVRDETTGESLKGVPSTTALTFSRQAGGAFGASDSVAVNCAGYF